MIDEYFTVIPEIEFYTNKSYIGHTTLLYNRGKSLHQSVP